MFKAVVGHSEDVDSIDAVNEVLSQCRREAPGLIPNAGFLFTSIDYNHETILKQINKRHPGLPLIGCTTDGELSSKLGFKDDSVTLILFFSDRIRFGAGLGINLSKNIKQACNSAVTGARTALKNKPPGLAVITPDSLTVSGVKVLDSLTRELGTGFPVFGGTAGDQYRMKKTFQFFGDRVYSDAVPVMLFSEPIAFSFGIGSGWRPEGRKLKVTKVKDNVVYKIDNRPALDIYLHYFGKGSAIFGEYPVAVFNKKTDNSFYIRSPIQFNDRDGSIVYSADIPPNAYIRFSEGTRNDLIEAAEEAVKDAVSGFPGSKPEAAIIFSCSARKALLGTRTREEFNIITGALDKDIKVCGFYTYGEVGPCKLCNYPSFHNSTFITLLFGEK
ncbi:MAG TPA: hypothetical protein ENN73_01365, partial [Firmicutes bacterium]|nr:hypothetical protein [Bacillota bacterium]